MKRHFLSILFAFFLFSGKAAVAANRFIVRDTSGLASLSVSAAWWKKPACIMAPARMCASP